MEASLASASSMTLLKPDHADMGKSKHHHGFSRGSQELAYGTWGSGVHPYGMMTESLCDAA